MENKEKGYISLYRSIQEHYLYPRGRKFTELEAWIDVLFMANYKEANVLIDMKKISVPRGSFITSELKLSQKWLWHRDKVRKFISLLITDMMIEKECTSKYTMITISNYDSYQGITTTQQQHNDSTTDSTTDSGLDTNNKENKVNKEINKTRTREENLFFDENEIEELEKPPTTSDDVREKQKRFYNMLMEAESWHSQIFYNYDITRSNVKKYLDMFLNDQFVKGSIPVSQAQYQSHFVNWIKSTQQVKQLSFLEKQKKLSQYPPEQ